MKGEEVTDDTCWIIKSHAPWIEWDSQLFNVNKMIVIVRNPSESCISFMHLTQTICHAAKVPFEPHVAYPAFWNWWVHYIVPLMNQWYQTYMQDTRERRLPTLFIRFEDLVREPEV